MPAPELFEGFADQQARHEADLVDRYGEGVREHFRAAEEVTKDWTKQDYLDAQRRGEEIDAKVLAVMQSGAAPSSPRAMAAVDEHYREVTRVWTPDKNSYTNLGQRYVDDPNFRARYDAKAPGFAEYLRDAIAAYASHQLG